MQDKVVRATTRAAAVSTGTVLPGRAEHHGRHNLAAGDLLVATDHHASSDSGDCRVTITATDARSDAGRDRGKVYSGRRKNGGMPQHARPGGDRFIGAGTRIAAVTDSGAPQLFDLATGTTV
ncbi:hypothetical protein [Nocardia xishanensis]|uniref:Uncharacterized protein n=1 Tax=Nocardia xishanensis TaxID=238964 RepID=A0ABW7XB63_9NOCA